MRVRLLAAVALCAGFAAPATAGQGTSPDSGTAPPAGSQPAPAVDVTRLPVNISRIGRQLRQAEVREQRDGMKIHYTIDVFGELPRISWITPLDNILTGDVPNTPPTHNDMIRMMTPLEFSAPVINIGSVPKRK